MQSVKSSPKSSGKISKEEESLRQKYISAPNEKLRKFYADMLKAKGWKVPKA